MGRLRRHSVGIVVVLALSFGAACGDEDRHPDEPLDPDPPPPTGDVTPPATITNLAVTHPTRNSLTLTWTATGDDGDSGKAASYDLRRASAPITDSSWAHAVPIAGLPVPAPSGSIETLVLEGLELGTTYHFAIRASDEVPNLSPISNSATGSTFGVGWHGVGSGMGGSVLSLAIYGGQLVAGGTFQIAGGTARSDPARWSGDHWNAMGSGIGFAWHGPEQVLALLADGSDLIAAGEFTTAGGSVVRNIAQWNGATWSPLGDGLGGENDRIHALVLFEGDRIAGGTFPGGAARWDGSSWNTLGGGVGGDDPSVRALAVYQGDLIAGGSFTTAGGAPASGIARWDGTAWHALGSGVGAASYPPLVAALFVYGGELIVGGDFDSAGGIAANGLARWDGNSWRALGSGVANGMPVAMLEYRGDLIVGGGFSAIDGVVCHNIARWNGTGWQPLGAGTSGGSAGPWVRALAVVGDELFAGGDFYIAGTDTVHHVARWIE